MKPQVCLECFPHAPPPPPPPSPYTPPRLSPGICSVSDFHKWSRIATSCNCSEHWQIDFCVVKHHSMIETKHPWHKQISPNYIHVLCNQTLEWIQSRIDLESVCMGCIHISEIHWCCIPGEKSGLRYIYSNACTQAMQPSQKSAV